MYKNFFRWVYFWLLMAAGFGLFISEEALNVWVCPLYRYLQHDHAQLRPHLDCKKKNEPDE
jgi:hypothetical protein